MTNLTDTEDFSSVVRLETTDRVQGGNGGKANEQAQALANRTKFLKARIDSLRYDVRDFGAMGDDTSRPLTAEEAAEFNSSYAEFGASGDHEFSEGDELDYAAIQSAAWKSANTGVPLFIPPNFRARTNKPITLQWTSEPIEGQPERPLIARIYGAGPSSVIKGYDIEAGRAVLELLGESNSRAVNCQIDSIQIEEDASCSVLSYCLRLSDGYCGINLNRVICKGANGLLLGVASSLSYAQIAFTATQCQFWSNWDLAWGADDGDLAVYSLNNESFGARWDSAIFNACFFWGQANPRAFTLNFETCMFVTPPGRAVPDNVVIYIGSAAFNNCYFEDHRIAIVTLSETSDVPSLSVRNSHFSSANNLGPLAHAASAIQCGRTDYEHGAVSIENCRFGTTHTVAAIDLYGPLSCSVINCGGLYVNVNVAPTINTAGDVRLVTRNPNGEESYDVQVFDKVRIQCAIFLGSADFLHDVAGQAILGVDNPDDTAAACSALRAKSQAFEAKMIAFGAAHASLANQLWLTTSETNAPVVLAPGGVKHFKVDDTWALADYSVNGAYGLGAQNTNVGASAYAFIYATNGVAFGGFYCFGTGHVLANQIYMGGFTAHPVFLAAGSLPVAKLDPTDRRMKMRDYGTVGGLWYQQTADFELHTSTAVTAIIGTGVGSVVIPASTLAIGSKIELELIGTRQSVGAENINFTFDIAGASLGPILYAHGGATSATPFVIKCILTVRTVGSGGTFDYVLLKDGAPYAIGSGSINTTTNATIGANGQHSVSDANNKVVSRQYSMTVTV